MHKLLCALAYIGVVVPMIVPTSPGTAATPKRQASVNGSASRAFDDFITAFNALDEAHFDAAWAEDATLFFPAAVPGWGGARFDGKADVLNVFHAFFRSARRGKTGPNFLNITPQDVVIQNYDPIALVSFNLKSTAGTGRRTVVMRRIGKDWRVVHMHASTILAPAANASVPAGDRVPEAAPQ